MSTRIVDKPGFNHMILRCPEGHEFCLAIQGPYPSGRVGQAVQAS